MSSVRPSSIPAVGSRVAGSVAMGIGAIWLGFWLSGSASQWSAAGVITVKTNMALGLCLAGSAMVLLGSEPPSGARHWAGMLAAAVVFLLGILIASEHLFGWNAGIDELLAREVAGAAATSSPNRVGPLGATSLALLGAGLLALGLRRRPLVPILGLCVFLIDLVPTIGYLCGIFGFYATAVTGIAWSTVVALISLALGLIVACPDQAPMTLLRRDDLGGHLLRRMLPVALVLPLVLGILLRVGERHGLYESPTGDGLLVLTLMATFSAVLWRTAEHVSESSHQLRSLNRTLKARSDSDQAMMRATDEVAYLQAVCQVVVQDCGHAMVWIGFAEDDEARTVRPVAWAGFEEGYLGTLRVTWADTERGQGPTGRCIREIQVCMCRNMLTDAAFHPWREEALRRGYASSIAFPLLSHGKALGALTLYSCEPDAFSADEVRLLGGLADDLAYGLVTLRTRQARAVAEDALARSKAEFEAIFNALSDAVVLADAERRVLLANPAFTDMFGYSLAEAQGRVTRFLYQADSDFDRLGRQIYGGGVPLGTPCQIQYRRKDGTAFWAESVGNQVRTRDGKVLGYLGVHRDITDRREAEAALRRQREDLRRTAEELARSNQDLEQFAYVTSHDLQEPLRMVSNFSELLVEELDLPEEGPTRQYLGYIRGGALRMQALVRDLLAYSRASACNRPFQVVALDSVLETALADLHVGLEESGAVVVHDPLPRVFGDATMLGQLLLNLLGNAIKFHRVEVAPRVHVGARFEDGRWTCWVKDNGIGIAKQYQEQIFLIFQRLHGREEYPGTGIGLSVCRRIVERHGGRIWVTSTAGEGTTFSFTLPAVPQAPGGDGEARPFPVPTHADGPRSRAT